MSASITRMEATAADAFAAILKESQRVERRGPDGSASIHLHPYLVDEFRSV